MTGRDRTLLLLAAGALATSAQASYGQMRLDGLGLLVVFALTVAYGMLVDLALFIRIFRYRAALVIGSIVGLGVVFLVLTQVVTPGEWLRFFERNAGDAWPVVLAVTGAVFLPFIVIAPLAQYLAMRDGRRWPGWITAWMVLQMALLPGFLVLAGTEQFFWQKEYAAGKSAGSQATAGAFAGILERAEQRRQRVWGTGWTYPRQQEPSVRTFAMRSAWINGLAAGIDANALISATEPLGAADGAALRALATRHYYPPPNTRAKLLWDALEPGGFARVLAPRGVDETGPVDEEVMPVLLELLEKDRAQRLCPGGRMTDADRALLKALVQAKGRVWNAVTRTHELRAQWESYPQRVARIC